MRWLLGVLFLAAGLTGCLADDGGTGEATIQRVDPQESGDGPSEPENMSQEEPVPWALEASVEVGFVAAAGLGPLYWVGGWDEDRCPEAEVYLPEGTERVVFHAQMEAVRTDDPGAGLMMIEISPPEGESVYLDGALATAGMDNQEHKQRDPAPGTWAIEGHPFGPLVTQTWTVTVEAEGSSLGPPDELEGGTTC